MLKSLSLGGAVLGAGSLFHGPALKAATGEAKPSPAKNNQNPWIYHFNIGDLEAWSISDGILNFGGGLNMMYPESERENMKASLEAHLEPTTHLPVYINILVVRSDKEVMIFDAGFGIVDHPDRGWFIEGLESIGIKRSEVTAAFLSHAHIDHIAGLLAPNGTPMFPNAAVYVTPEEYNFWPQKTHDFSRTKRSPKGIESMLAGAQRSFELLQPQIQTTPVGSKLFGGMVTVEDGFGHTPGHGLFRIASAGDSLLHIVDLAHSHVLMFRDPKWVIALDHDLDQAVQTRRRVFGLAAQNRTRCYGFHVPWPGLGGIAKDGSKESYAWIPERLNWS